MTADQMLHDATPRHAQLNRRALLKGSAALVGSCLAGAATAQVDGTGPGGGALPLRRPMGQLDYLDRKQYISNMTIHAHLSGARGSGGEPLTSMWAKGRQRLLY